MNRIVPGRWIIALGAALSLSAAGHATNGDKGDWRAWTPAGPAISCLPITEIRESYVRSDSVIDFRTVQGKMYRVTLPSPCPELGFERAFSYETSLSELCSTDIIHVLRQGEPRFPGASCGLSSFQPVTPATAG